MTASALLLPLLLLAASCAAQWWGGYNEGAELCESPLGSVGECKSLAYCPALLQLLRASPRPSGAVEFLRASFCGFYGRYPHVCCVQNYSYKPPPTETTTTTTTTPRPTRQPTGNQKEVAQHPNLHLLPKDCGVDFSERIFGGNVTEIDEYPWLLLLGYVLRGGPVQFLCGGALINERYAVTAAHCVNGRDISEYRLTRVRLGEYNTQTDRDCVEQLTGEETCADPVLNFGIEQKLPHPMYDPYSGDQFNDIALLRLDRKAPVTDYIRPICLPLGNALHRSYKGQELVVAGWGKTENRAFSPIKMKVGVPVVSEEECVRIYKGKREVRYSTQVCAGGKVGKDSCTGDSGGPLMAVESTGGANRHHVAGIVSYGPRQCGQAGWPGVYTRVAAYMPWILDSLRP